MDGANITNIQCRKYFHESNIFVSSNTALSRERQSFPRTLVIPAKAGIQNTPSSTP